MAEINVRSLDDTDPMPFGIHKNKPMQMVLNLAKLQLLPELNIGIRRLQRWQDGKNVSASGLGWNLPNQYAACYMVTKKHSSAPVATWMDGAES